MKAGSFFGPLRGAISGKAVSPPLFESIEALGRQETLRRALTPAALKLALLPFHRSRQLGVPEAELGEIQADRKLDILIPVIQERIKRLDEAAGWLDWAFMDADEISYKKPKLLLGRKLDAAQSIEMLQAGAALLEKVEPFAAETIHQAFRAKAEALAVKAGSFFGPLRGAISGKAVSPPLFESIEALGRQETLRRIERAATKCIRCKDCWRRKGKVSAWQPCASRYPNRWLFMRAKWMSMSAKFCQCRSVVLTSQRLCRPMGDSSIGRTPGSGSGNRGSNPCPPAWTGFHRP